MRKPKYTLIVDGKVAWTSNSVRRCKEQAQVEFDCCNAFFAQILFYKKQYAARFYNTKWNR